MTKASSTPRIALQKNSSASIPPRGKWINFRFGHEASLPGVTNHLGSLQIEADPVAVKHVVFPPVSSAEETTGMTTLNGRLIATQGQSVAIRWSPAAVERKYVLDGWKLTSTTTMPPGESAVLIRVELTNTTKKPNRADLRLRLSGRCRNTGKEGYLWGVPAVATTVAALNRPEGLDVIETFDSALGAVQFHNQAERCCCVEGIVGAKITWDNGRVILKKLVPGKQAVSFYLLLVFGQHLEETLASYQRLATSPDDLEKKAVAYWDEQWQSAAGKTDANVQRDGINPDRLSAPLKSLYNMAILTTTYLRRDYPTAGKALYLTLFPRHGEGSFYLWDIGQSAPFVARVDPDGLAAMVESAAAAIDVYSQQSMNAFTGRGGGWHYAANLWSLFRMAWSVLCVKRDLAWLDKPLAGIRAGQTLFQMLEELALAWTTCTPGQKALTHRTRAAGIQSAAPGATDSGSAAFAYGVEMPLLDPAGKYPFTGVADCGNRGTLLEGTTTYAHQVASINAGYVWMMRCLADLQDHRGEAPRAVELRTLADNLAGAILKLYRPDDAFFSCGKPDGSVNPSRVSQDHLMVMNCMPQDLPPAIRRALVKSFQQELQTPAWMRCTSPADSDVVSGYRSDVTFVGCYAGWVAMMAEGLCKIGYRKIAIDWLGRISAITAQGPFAQSYWAETQIDPVHGGPAKCTDELPHGTHWCEMGGVSFGNAVLRTLLDRDITPF